MEQQNNKESEITTKELIEAYKKLSEDEKIMEYINIMVRLGWLEQVVKKLCELLKEKELNDQEQVNKSQQCEHSTVQ